MLELSAFCCQVFEEKKINIFLRVKQRAENNLYLGKKQGKDSFSVKIRLRIFRTSLEFSFCFEFVELILKVESDLFVTIFILSMFLSVD